MSITIKSDQEIAVMMQAGRIVTTVLEMLKSQVKAGMQTEELDVMAAKEVEKLGAVPSLNGYRGFPANLCVSINDEVIHGIPGKRLLRKGDIVSLDLGINLHGYISDAAHTYPVGDITGARKKLLNVTEECLNMAVAVMTNGSRLNDISKAIFDHAKDNGFSVVRQYCGHGVGTSLHEEPQIRNYIGPGPNPKLKPGMVLSNQKGRLSIEPAFVYFDVLDLLIFLNPNRSNSRIITILLVITTKCTCQTGI